MLFNSVQYLIFLPIVFIIYWNLVKGRNLRNLFLIAASYLFYGWWDWRFLILIFITTSCSFASGLLLNKYDRVVARKTILWSNVALNLGILGLFKYFNFFARNFAEILRSMGMTPDDVTLDLILPVGISFYTFQALSYTIDVYRRKIKATTDVIAFFIFISFFPQLVAGPIERATNLLPQFERDRKFDYEKAVDGCRQILWGLFKKMVVADTCAVHVNEIFGAYDTEGSILLFLGAILFTFQIYGDFSGYSDVAIGTANLFNVNLMTNFKNPYFSRDVAEFWRRWHISLNTWFREYVYIPLGGSRCSKGKVLRNTMVVFLLSGFWHGAEWTYVAWGIYHGILFVPLIISGKNTRYTDYAGSGRFLPSFKESLAMGLTSMLVVIGWILFRADNIEIAWGYLSRMFTAFDVMNPITCKTALMWCLILVVIEWFTRKKTFPLQIEGHGILRFRAARWMLYAGLTMIVLIFAGQQTDFIYFQF